MADWKAGDLAVCVDLSVAEHHLPITAIEVRRIYRVERVFVSPRNGNLVLVLHGVRADTSDGGYASFRFRKLLPAEPCFTEAMRSLKPKVEA